MRGRDTGCSSNVKVRGILTAGSPHASASGTSFEVCENSGITVRIETESLCELHRKTHPVARIGQLLFSKGHEAMRRGALGFGVIEGLLSGS